MPFKFEKLDVWRLSLDYLDMIYDVADQLPSNERFNLRSQIIRAGTSVGLNIAEGAVGQTDPEQVKFLGYSIRSLVETVACLHMISRRYPGHEETLRNVYSHAEALVARLHSMRRAIAPNRPWLKEEPVEYGVENNEENLLSSQDLAP